MKYAPAALLILLFGFYELKPSRVKPGKYSVRVTNATSGEVASSENIRIKRRIPLGFVISAVVLVPAAIYFWAIPMQDEPLPDMPQPN